MALYGVTPRAITMLNGSWDGDRKEVWGYLSKLIFFLICLLKMCQHNFFLTSACGKCVFCAKDNRGNLSVYFLEVSEMNGSYKVNFKKSNIST